MPTWDRQAVTRWAGSPSYGTFTQTTLFPLSVTVEIAFADSNKSSDGAQLWSVFKDALMVAMSVCLKIDAMARAAHQCLTSAGI